jgi:hypothetical protein
VADPINEPIDAETADDSDQGGQQETERTITIAGLPILMTGIAAILGVRWIRRRSGNRRSSTP